VVRASVTFASTVLVLTSFLDRFSDGLLSVCDFSSLTEATGLLTAFSGAGSVTRRTSAFLFAVDAGGTDSRCASAVLGSVG
jgi:hypothetical protein